MSTAAVDRAPGRVPGRVVAIAGFLAGLLLVGALVWNSRLPTETVVPGTDLTADGAAGGGLELIGSGDGFISDPNLTPGNETSGRLTVSNPTSREIQFQLFATSPTPQANETLTLAIDQNGVPVGEGAISEFETGSRLMTLAPDSRSTIDVSVGLPAGADDRYQGAIKQLTVLLAPPEQQIEVTP